MVAPSVEGNRCSKKKNTNGISDAVQMHVAVPLWMQRNVHFPKDVAPCFPKLWASLLLVSSRLTEIQVQWRECWDFLAVGSQCLVRQASHMPIEVALTRRWVHQRERRPLHRDVTIRVAMLSDKWLVFWLALLWHA